MKTPYTVTPPLLYRKIGVYRGIYYFLVFALKGRLWVLVRTALRQFQPLPTIYVYSKYKKNITTFHLKIVIFTAMKNCSLLHRRVIVMSIIVITFKLPR